ncbi:tRNA (guanine-N-7) methyltransferase, Trmb type [Artemisia annua]|uniref:tRNA (guanine(46)-N(7))-methyltransferase n=1 Tax=Artemisia annua TaxID=35608 RepID=A0A2U1LKW3_ARTAN|nr:tRNA (guanine-N-7) methyltransferase, Trmb type [Artemisia annua]
MANNTILKLPLISTFLTAKTALKSSVISLCHCTTTISVPQQQKQREPQIRSPQLVALEYADLSIPHIISEEGAVRVRQHVNPLSTKLSVPVDPPNWNDVFEDPKLPLVVDIGSGSGRFLMWLAKRNPGSKNYMGLEIREKLVTRAKTWAKELALSNIHFLFANASISFKQLLSTYPGPLMLVSISCPDPHFKKRHHKRRIVQKPLVEAIVDRLMPGGQVFIQSDVLEVAIDMRQYFDEESQKLIHVDKIDSNILCDDAGWLPRNPMGIRTEREIHAEYEGAKIYRRMYQKNS